MPHAVPARNLQDEHDDELVNKLIADDGSFDFGGNLLDRDLELGEKAHNAIDYEDQDDSSLPDEEDAVLDTAENPEESLAAQPITNGQGLYLKQAQLLDAGSEVDDLFGDGGQSSPRQDGEEPSFPWDEDPEDTPVGSELVSRSNAPMTNGLQTQATTAQPAEVLDPEFIRKKQIQEELFRQSRRDLDQIPCPPENNEELLASLWPKFEKESIPKWTSLFPPKRARYAKKVPPKQPKPFQDSKLRLEIAQDDSRNFILPVGGAKRTHEEMEMQGILATGRENGPDEESDGEISQASDYENMEIGGSTWQDIQIICGDWDIYSDADIADIVNEAKQKEVWANGNFDARHQDPGGDLIFGANAVGFDFPEDQVSTPPFKKQRTQFSQPGAFDQALENSAAFHDPELATARLAKKLVLDLNDPYLLIDDKPVIDKKHLGGRERIAFGREGRKHNLHQRYNISNDEAYDLLKENHQNKVRGTLGNVTIEHSMPALRLQYPFVIFSSHHFCWPS